jgi:hypothetical protein
MTIDEAFKLYRFIVNTVQSGKITPEQFNLSAVRAQLAWFNYHYRSYQKTQEITDSLAPFVQTSTISIDTDGKSTKPDGTSIKDTVTGSVLPQYFHALAFRFNHVVQDLSDCDNLTYTTREVPVRMIDEDKLAGYLSGEIMKPSLRFPIVTQYSNFFQFHPKNLQRSYFSYLRKALEPKWAYTKDANGRPVYDPVNSVGFDAPDHEQEDIILRMCEYAGINLREGQLEAYAQRAIQEEG